MEDEKPFVARVFINNGAVLISIPKIMVDSRDLKGRIKQQEKRHKSKKCFGEVILKLADEIN